MTYKALSELKSSFLLNAQLLLLTSLVTELSCFHFFLSSWLIVLSLSSHPKTCFLASLLFPFPFFCCHSHAWVKVASRSQQSSSRHTASPRSQMPGSETLRLPPFGPLLCSTGWGQSAVDPQTLFHFSPSGKYRPGPKSEGEFTTKRTLVRWMYMNVYVSPTERIRVTVRTLTPAGMW